MEKDRFKIVEDEDGVIIYDESDDYVPGEEEILDEDNELDTEYILRESKRQEAQEAEEKHRQKWISAGVIIAMVAFIAGICFINFKGIFL